VAKRTKKIVGGIIILRMICVVMYLVLLVGTSNCALSQEPCNWSNLE